MKTKILVSLIALLAVMTLSIVSATDLGVTVNKVEINGVDIQSASLITFAGDVVPVKLELTSTVDAKDATISVYISGHKENMVTSKKFHLLAGTYPVMVSMKLPTNVDLEESMSLVVDIDTENAGSIKQTFDFNVQRESYVSDILDVDSDKTVNAGDSLAVDVVVKNRGYETLEDLFVVVSIPELGVQKKAYFEDLSPVDDCNDNCDNQDSAQRRIYLKVPTNAEAGVYDMKVEAYNSDTNEVVSRKIVVVGAAEESKVVVPISGREIAAGTTETFDIYIVNSGSKVGIYEIVPETANGLTVSVDKPIVTVPAGSSATVKVSVEGSEKGTYTFAVNVNSETNLVKKVMLTANVKEKAFTSNITVLTIILAIIFLVLLVVLIVLLTRKPAKSEELEESYY